VGRGRLALRTVESCRVSLLLADRITVDGERVSIEIRFLDGRRFVSGRTEAYEGGGDRWEPRD
jgi:hypothetical protein